MLKSGLFDAQSRYGCGLKRYYIFLFGHATTHFKRISAITNEFANNQSTRVITPRFLQAFINLPSSTLSAVVDRYLSDEDYVRKQARSEASGYTEQDLFMILNCLSWALENLSDNLPLSFIDNLSSVYEDSGEEGDSYYFNDTDFEFYSGEDSIRIRTENFPAIRALYFDLQVRYEEDSQELINHLFEFLKLDSI